MNTPLLDGARRRANEPTHTVSLTIDGTLWVNVPTRVDQDRLYVGGRVFDRATGLPYYRSEESNVIVLPNTLKEMML